MPKHLLAAVAAGGIMAVAAAAAAAAPPAKPDGAALFAANCAACHQPDGKGIPGAFPALARSAFVVGNPDMVAQTVLNGRGGMPSFRDVLDDASLAATLSYVRASWGNKGKPIAAAQIAKNRVGKATRAERPIPAH